MVISDDTWDGRHANRKTIAAANSTRSGCGAPRCAVRSKFVAVVPARHVLRAIMRFVIPVPSLDLPDEYTIPQEFSNYYGSSIRAGAALLRPLICSPR
jgi:hypothetical protein